MNKLLEILDEFDNLPICFNYGERTAMKKFLSEKLIEYARSTIELPIEIYIQHVESAWDNAHKEMFERISRDIQSLNN